MRRRRGRSELWFRQEFFPRLWKEWEPIVMAAAFVWRRMLPRTTVIGVTGSLGKTTTKECLADVLAAQARTFRSHNSRNAPLSVALNILRIRPWHRYAVVEVAGSSPAMMARPARLLRPDIAIVLNVLRTHTTDFADLAAHAKEKQRLVSELRPGGIAILNADDPFTSTMTAPAGSRVLWFGESSGNDVEVADAKSSWPDRLSFTMRTGADTRRIDTQLIGTQWITAAAAVMTAGIALGIPAADAAATLAKSQPFNGRLKPVKLPVGATVLRDEYNASVDSVDASLSVLKNAEASRRMLVISDMSDFGKNRKQRLKYLGARAAEVADAVVFIGENAEYGKRRAIDAGISESEAHAFDSVRQAASFLRGELREGDLVLLKGRTTDHVTRIIHAQLGSIECWREHCPKLRLCDSCWELGFKANESGAHP